MVASDWSKILPGEVIAIAHLNIGLVIPSVAQWDHAIAALLNYKYSRKLILPSRFLSNANIKSSAKSFVSSPSQFSKEPYPLKVKSWKSIYWS